jgi:ABC-type multidrug transport system fused ATPase/permease subunit
MEIAAILLGTSILIILILWYRRRKTKQNALKNAVKEEEARFKKNNLVEAVHKASLEANREGKFSDVQKELIRQRLSAVSWWKHLGILIGAIIAAIVVPIFLVAPIFPLIAGDSCLVTIVLIIFVVFAVVSTVIWIRRRMRGNVEKIIRGGIESGFGKYYFDFSKKKYIVKCGEHSLEPLLPVNWEPGTYRFYFVQKLEILLSAEPCDMKSVPSFNARAESLTAILERTIGFDTTDLGANQNGQLSERQNLKLKETIIALVGIVIGSILVGFALVFYLQGVDPTFLLVPFAIPVLMGILLFRPIYRIISDLKRGTVVAVTGRGWRKPHGEPSTSEQAVGLVFDLFGGPLPNAILQFLKTISLLTEKHQYYIGEKTFDVSNTTWVALGESLTYTAYYLPHTNRLVSIEHILT